MDINKVITNLENKILKLTNALPEHNWNGSEKDLVMELNTLVHSYVELIKTKSSMKPIEQVNNFAVEVKNNTENFANAFKKAVETALEEIRRQQ